MRGLCERITLRYHGVVGMVLVLAMVAGVGFGVARIPSADAGNAGGGASKVDEQVITVGDASSASVDDAGVTDDDDVDLTADSISGTVSSDDSSNVSSDNSGVAVLVDSAAVSDNTGDVTILDSLDTDSASITNFTLEELTSGTAPFDSDDTAGNDSSADNLIIRSFDRATYTLRVTITSDEAMTYYRNARIGFRINIPVSSDYAVVDTDEMGWVDSTQGYAPTTVVNQDGSQTVTVYRLLSSTETNPTVVPGTYEFPVIVQVRGLTQGETFQPSFDAWMVPNTETNREAHVTPEALIVSSRPQFNIRLTTEGYMLQSSGGANNWDFTTADSDAKYYDSDVLNSELGVQAGTLTRLGYELEIMADDPDKGVKGTEYPAEGSTLSFDIHMANTMRLDTSKVNKVDSSYQPYFWMAYSSQGEQNDTRDSEMRKLYVPPTNNSAFPQILNTGTDKQNYVYNGGTMQIEQNRSDSETVFTVNVNDWAVDGSMFPKRTQDDTSVNCSTSIMFGSDSYPCNEYRYMVVSVGLLYYMNPTTIDGVSVVDYYGEAVTIQQKAEASDISITGRSGSTVTEQSSDTDNTVSLSQSVDPRGTFQGLIQFACSTVPFAQADGNDTDCSGWNSGTGGNTTGTDKTYAGARVRVFAGTQVDTSSQTKLAGVIPTHLVKFDDKAFYLDGDLGLANPYNQYKRATGTWFYYGNGNFTPSSKDTVILYAVKPDGTGWASDEEQAKTRMVDLDYYESLEEAESHGTPVGLLLYSPDSSPMQNMDRMGFPSFMLHVREDAEINSTAQITSEPHAWTRQALYNAGVLPDTLTVDSSYDEWADWAETQNPLELSKQVAWTYSDYSDNYVKATYDENGTYVAGTDDKNRRYGDTILIAGEQGIISVDVAQTTSSGSTKTLYDLDNNERYVDWVISAQVLDSTNAINWTTTVTITACIPDNTTLVDGSTYWDGDYTENTPNAGTVTNGTIITPVQQDGQCYKFRVENVPVNGETHYLRLTTLIGDPTDPDNDVSNNDQLTITAEIQSTRDIQVARVNNKKYATSSIRVSKTRGNSLWTQATSIIAEVNDQIGFVDMIANNSNDTKTNVLAIDRLPTKTNGDSNYHGELTLNTIQLSGVGINVTSGDITVRATTLPKYSTMELSSITEEQVNSNEWTTLTINDDGTLTIPASVNQSSITAVAFQIATIPSNTRINVTITMDTSGNQPSDLYVNRLTNTENTVYAMVTVANRSVSGLVFIDSTMDGARSENDEMLSGVNVSLVNANDATNTAITLLDGATASTTTDENGAYEFNTVPAGTYRLVFTPSDTWEKYRTTTKQADGVNETLNSDADPQFTLYTLTGASITLETMPTVDNMTFSRYADTHQDVGLIRIANTTTLPSTGDQQAAIIILLVTILFTLCAIVLTVRNRRQL